MSGRKETVTVIDDVPGGESETYEFNFPARGVITGINVATHVGQQYDLQYRFLLDREGTEDMVNLLEPVGKAFLGGNGEEYDLAVRHDVDKGDTLRVELDNEESEWSYTANARIPVDYHDHATSASIFGGLF